MRADNILVIAVDGLRAAALGAYGNTAFATPALDRLAADSLVFDWWFANAVELPQICPALWQAIPQSTALGYQSTLVTDEPAIVSLDAVKQLHECVELSATDAARSADISRTALARLFAAVCEQIETGTNGPRLIWAHAQGMYGPWDAPLELQEQLLAREEGDPPPADAIEPPEAALDESTDPDIAFRWSCAYAAQVMTLDACIDAVLHSIQEAGASNWLVAFCGVRGFPLGEHGRVGGVDGRMYAEQLHVPLLLQLPDGSQRLSRSDRLASHDDLSVLLMGAVRGEVAAPERDAIIALGPDAYSLRTADWSLRCDSQISGGLSDECARCELFVRPDDRWEANNVASLCPEVVAQLLARLAPLSAN